MLYTSSSGARRARGSRGRSARRPMRFFGKKTCSPRTRIRSPMFNEHISGAEPDRCDALVDREARAAAGRELDDRVGFRAQPLVQLAGRSPGPSCRPVGVAGVHVEHGGAGSPGVDPLLEPGGVTGQMPPTRYRLERQAKSSAAVPNDSHNFLDGLQLPGDEASRLKPPTIDGKSLTDFIDRRKNCLMPCWLPTRMGAHKA